jgi:hypothetical protein
MKRTPLFLIVSPLLIGIALALYAMHANNVARAAGGAAFFFSLAVPISALAGYVDADLVDTYSRVWRAIGTAVMGAFIAVLLTICGLLFAARTGAFAASVEAFFKISDQPPLAVLAAFVVICGASAGVCSLFAPKGER